MKPGDRSKSLQDLEGKDWGEPTFNSYLVRKCHELRRKPLAEFDVEDLRIMIGQKIGLPHLLPIAMERLEADPIVGGHYFAGDLLAVVLAIDDTFWSGRPDLLRRVRLVVNRVRELLPSMCDTKRESMTQILSDATTSTTGDSNCA